MKKGRGDNRPVENYRGAKGRGMTWKQSSGRGERKKRRGKLVHSRGEGDWQKKGEMMTGVAKEGKKNERPKWKQKTNRTDPL